MDFKKHLETAWVLTLKHIASLIIMTFVMLIVSVFTVGILAPVTMAGYTKSILLMLREKREPKIPDLFSQFHLFLPLLGFSIVVFIVVMIGFMLLFFPGLIISLFVSFACIYMIPLMVDKKMNLIDAVKESYSMSVSKGVLTDNIVVVLIYIGICMIGSTVFIGTLFTQPLATIFLLSVYEEKTKSGSQEKEAAKQ